MAVEQESAEADEQPISDIANVFMEAMEALEGVPTTHVLAGVTHFYAFLLATMVPDPQPWIDLLPGAIANIEGALAEHSGEDN